MKPSKKVKSKEPKPKLHFRRVSRVPPKRNALDDDDAPGKYRAGLVTPGPNFKIIEKHPDSVGAPTETEVTENEHYKDKEIKTFKTPEVLPHVPESIASTEDDSSSVPLPVDDVDTDVWVTINTVDSGSVLPTKHDHADSQPHPHSSKRPQTLKKEKAAKTTRNKKNVKHVLEYKGRELSVTDLLPATLGQGAEVLFNKYSIDGRVFPASSSTSLNPGPFTQKTVLAVEHGVVYDATKLKNRRPLTTQGSIGNSFADTHDLGPPGALQRWLVNIGKFYDDEVHLSLDGNIMTVQANQNTRPGQTRTTTESFEIPLHCDIADLRVYKNRQIGTLIIAYVPQSNR